MFTSSAVRSTLESSSAPERNAPKLPSPGLPMTAAGVERFHSSVAAHGQQALRVAEVGQRHLRLGTGHAVEKHYHAVVEMLMLVRSPEA